MKKVEKMVDITHNFDRQSYSYNCALFASCDCEALETEYYIYDKNIHRMFLLYAKARDG